MLTELDTLLRLIARAQQAQDVPALRFALVNETHALVPYRQALMFERAHSQQKFKLVCASGLSSVAEDSPFSVWVTQFVQRLPLEGGAFCLDYSDAANQDQPGWMEWLPEHLLMLSVKGASTSEVLATAMLARETPWQEQELHLLTQLFDSYGYCLEALKKDGRHRRWARWGQLWRNGPRRYGMLAAVLLAMFVPVRMSVLAPAEVVALQGTTVAAPQDGVIGSFQVQPNAPVKVGDLLFSLDDTVLVNRREVARKALDVALADEHTTRQRAFEETKGRADLAMMTGKVREKEAELAAIDAQTARIEVRAEHDGIAIFSDPNDWLGRPIQTGERVMRLARPDNLGVLIWLGVADAINPELGADVQLFLHTDPLRPRAAQLSETSYQAVMSPNDVASYRLRAQFAGGQSLPRIGLRGTARIAGEWVSLGYYLFRRPVAALREKTGW